MSSDNYTRDPLIEWSQYYCRFCTKPCNGCTNCELDAKPDTKEGYQYQGLFVPIKSKSCSFRNVIAYRVVVNFPVSRTLITTLNKLPGIDVLKPAGPHEMYVEVNKLFELEKLQSLFNQTYVAFIKGQQSNKFLVNEIVNEDLNCLITLPNGNSTLTIPEIKDILDNEFNKND